MGLISVGTHPYKIKKQNSKMYYTTFTEPYKYFRKGFYKVFHGILLFYIVYSTMNFIINITISKLIIYEKH
jgi:hypothetical protein